MSSDLGSISGKAVTVPEHQHTKRPTPVTTGRLPTNHRAFDERNTKLKANVEEYLDLHPEEKRGCGDRCTAQRCDPENSGRRKMPSQCANEAVTDNIAADGSPRETEEGPVPNCDKETHTTAKLVQRIFKIAAISTTIASAALIIPCRIVQEKSPIYRLAVYIAYGLWFLSFSVVVGMLVAQHASRLRKKLYACFKFILTLHLLGLRAQAVHFGGELVTSGPAAITASAFCWSMGTAGTWGSSHPGTG